MMAAPLHDGGLPVARTGPDSQAEIVNALRERRSYPGPVTDVEVIETHMAWVFLTDRHAYKLKKPLRRELFDYTGVAARRRACQTELDLNRRLALDVYLAVVPVVSTEGGLRVEVCGEPVDWLVKMRRLPRERMLDTCIARGTVRPWEVDRLLRMLVAFYARAAPARMQGSEYAASLLYHLEAKSLSLQRPRYGLDPTLPRAIAEAQRRWIESHTRLLGRCAVQVVDAHGDLRPEHVCLEAPTPVVIDCLEFSRALRLLDPVSELSFLSLECTRLGADWIGKRLLEKYTACVEDALPASLLDFYRSYHALVRAAVAVWHLDDPAVPDPERWRKRARGYLAQAQSAMACR